MTGVTENRPLFILNFPFRLRYNDKWSSCEWKLI